MSLMKPLLKQEALLERYAGQEGGKPKYQPAERVKCRIEKAVARQLSGMMAQHTSSTTMFMIGDPVPNGSRVAYNGMVFTVGDCEECWTTKLDHLELMLI